MTDFPSSIISHPLVVDPNFDPEEWNEFSRTAVNGTLFHTLRFLSYHPPERFSSHHVAVRRKGNLAAIFPGVIIREMDKSRSWVSHPGASYGGPAWSPKLRYHHLEHALRAIVDHARELGMKRIRITPPPCIYNDQPEQPLEFALARFGFKVMRTELTQAVRLDFDVDELLGSFTNKTRTAFRRAARHGLKFRVIKNPTQDEFDRFWEILVENREGLGVKPAHSREEIVLLHKLLPDDLMMAVIERDGEIIAEIWNFAVTKTTLLEFYMAHIADEQGYRPVPFLTYHSLLWAKRQGFRYMDFGISSIWSDPTWGLLKFKENFGAKHFLRQTWQWEQE